MKHLPSIPVIVFTRFLSRQGGSAASWSYIVKISVIIHTLIQISSHYITQDKLSLSLSSSSPSLSLFRLCLSNVYNIPTQVILHKPNFLFLFSYFSIMRVYMTMLNVSKKVITINLSMNYVPILEYKKLI